MKYNHNEQFYMLTGSGFSQVTQGEAVGLTFSWLLVVIQLRLLPVIKAYY